MSSLRAWSKIASSRPIVAAREGEMVSVFSGISDMPVTLSEMSE